MDSERERTVENVRKLMDLEVERIKSTTGGDIGSESGWRDYIWRQGTHTGHGGGRHRRRRDKIGAIGRNKWKLTGATGGAEIGSYWT